jgi:hypothetical protein
MMDRFAQTTLRNWRSNAGQDRGNKIPHEREQQQQPGSQSVHGVDRDIWGSRPEVQNIP